MKALKYIIIPVVFLLVLLCYHLSVGHVGTVNTKPISAHTLKKNDESAKPYEDSVRLPFLGVVKVSAREENITVKGDLLSKTLRVRILNTKDGMPFRIEYASEGALNFEFPANELEEIYSAFGESIDGIPAKQGDTSLIDILGLLAHLIGDGSFAKVLSRRARPQGDL